MQGTAAVTLSNENGLSRSRPSAHLQPPPTPPYGVVYGRQPGRSVHPVPCPPTNQRCSACAPTASISPAAATTAHLSERSSPTWHALRTA
jgi:hypothetical protein